MDLIRKFVEQVIEKSDYTELDKYYLYNHVLHLVGKCEKECQEASIIDVKDALVEQAVLNQKIDDLSSSKDSLGCELMDLITPIPSVLNQRFNEMYAQDKNEQLLIFTSSAKQTITSRRRQLLKISISRRRLTTAILKLRSTFPSRKKIPNRLRWLKTRTVRISFVSALHGK